MSDYDAWAHDYDLWAAGTTADVPFYVSLAHEAAEPIVELAAGTGRIAIPIARETGKRVIGIDRSPAMLAVGRERAGDLPVDFRLGDFRDFTVEQPVELVICPARSLLHAPSLADKRAVFDAAARALKPGGRFGGTPSPSTRRSRPRTAGGDTSARTGAGRRLGTCRPSGAST
ncbi:MAG TPA: class I SAM-dependent methyltransferase [Gaiellaceae bacterium]|nr:class I SAM-dependent methyltransferase [Gaiellaceae bacterium]